MVCIFSLRPKTEVVFDSFILFYFPNLVTVAMISFSSFLIHIIWNLYRSLCVLVCLHPVVFFLGGLEGGWVDGKNCLLYQL